MRKVVLVLSMVLALSLTACAPQPWETAPVAKVTEPTIVQPDDYGQGVLYFPATGEVFAKSLSAYLNSHPEIVVTSNGGEVLGGNTWGHFVTVQPKPCACHPTPIN